MPRTARTVSSTGIYHVMVRGNNKQRIFFDDEDYAFFLKSVRECKRDAGFELYAYCLMPNHVHMLIKAGDQPLDHIYKTIDTRYAKWFNRKYDRVGHLFQDRFRSENVESERYFLTVLRYIIQNPIKAGLEQKIGNYRWNCFSDYKSGGPNPVIDCDYATDMLGSAEALITYLQQPNSDTALEMTEGRQSMPDSEALEIMRKITGCRSASEYKDVDRSLRKCHIGMMLEEGVSVEQISGFTGLSVSSVYRIK